MPERLQRKEARGDLRNSVQHPELTLQALKVAFSIDHALRSALQMPYPQSSQPRTFDADGDGSRTPTQKSEPLDIGWKCHPCGTVNVADAVSSCSKCGHEPCPTCAPHVKSVVGWACCLCGRLNPLGQKTCSKCESPRNVCCEEKKDWTLL